MNEQLVIYNSWTMFFAFVWKLIAIIEKFFKFEKLKERVTDAWSKRSTSSAESTALQAQDITCLRFPIFARMIISQYASKEGL